MKVRIEKGSYEIEECPICFSTELSSPRTNTVYCKGHKKRIPKVTNYLFVNTLQYGLFLRLCHEHFIPCEECQDKLHKQLINMCHWDIERQMQIYFWYNEVYLLSFNWLNKNQIFQPCGKCQVRLALTIKDAEEWIIGNKDYEPAIELWRKWKTDDKRTTRLDKMEKKAVENAIHIRTFYKEIESKKNTKDFDKYLDDLHETLKYYSKNTVNPSYYEKATSSSN